MPSLYTAITNAMTAAIVGTPSGAIYTSQDHTTPAYVRKTDGYLAALGVDISCDSPWNSKTLHNCGCTLLSSRIGATVYHYLGGSSSQFVGETMRFVTMSNVVVDRTITAISRLGTTDTLLLSLDSAATGITPAKVLPSDWRRALPKLLIAGGIPTQIIPAMFSNRNEAMSIAMWFGEHEQAGEWLVQGMDPSDADNYIPPPEGTNLDFVPYYSAPVTGDSGNTGMSVPIDGEYVVVGMVGGGAAEGPMFSRYITELNAAMDALVSGQSLSVIDLDAYYPNGVSRAHWSPNRSRADWTLTKREVAA